MQYIQTYFEEFWHLFAEMAPWLLLGFLVAGILHIYFPKQKVQKFLGKANLRSVINAALLGVPLPLCSCGVIPTGISFHNEGASKGASVSFIISTPQTGVDSIMVTYSLLGIPFAIIRPIVAFVTGILGGFFTNRLTKDEVVEKTDYVSDLVESHSDGKLLRMMKYAFVDFLKDIAKWLVIGLAAAALISVALPDDFFTMYLENEWLSMLLVLVASIPIYVCATGSVPIAAVLLMKGLSPGAALVFLMAGPATNSATIAVIGKAMGKKSLAIYLGSIIVGALFFGWIINQFLPASWFNILEINHELAHHGMLPEWLSIGSGIVLALLIINAYFGKRLFKRSSSKTTSDMNDIVKIKVSGMTCNHCKMSAENKLRTIEGIEFVEANPDNNSISLTGDQIDLTKVDNYLSEIGFSYQGKL